MNFMLRLWGGKPFGIEAYNPHNKKQWTNLSNTLQGLFALLVRLWEPNASAQPSGVKERPEPLISSSRLHCLGPQYNSFNVLEEFLALTGFPRNSSW